MSLIASFSMLDSAEQWRAGICAFRNASEWTEAEMMRIVERANQKAAYRQRRNEYHKLHGTLEGFDHGVDDESNHV
jgi:hypothetical protein